MLATLQECFPAVQVEVPHLDGGIVALRAFLQQRFHGGKRDRRADGQGSGEQEQQGRGPHDRVQHEWCSIRQGITSYELCIAICLTETKQADYFARCEGRRKSGPTSNWSESDHFVLQDGYPLR